jgi:ribonuclease P protein component
LRRADSFFLSTGRNKFAVLVSKKLGKAHVRNLHKRWAREAFRQNQHQFQVAGSVVVSFKSTAESYQQVEDAILKAYELAIQDRRVDD